MPNNSVHQIQRLSGEGLLNAINDIVPGGVVALTGQQVYGQLGQRIELDHADALRLSKTSVGTLYGGVYQYVKTKAASSAAPARGLIAFYADATDIAAYTVTPDCPTNGGCIAGVYISAPTKGYCTYIQVEGLASVQFAAAITRATPAAQDMVFVTSGANTAQQEEGATAVTVNILARSLGIAAEAPVAAAIKLVELWKRFTDV